MTQWGWGLPGFPTVELFGTVVHETQRAYRFVCEDEGPPVWIGKSIAAWDGVTMTVPRWLARKHKWVVTPPPDDDPVWKIALLRGRVFVATDIVPKSRPPHKA